MITLENIISYLVPLIFILAFVLPKFKKKQQQKSNPSEPVETKKPQTGMISKLNKMLEEYIESDQEVIKKEKEDAESHDDWWNEDAEEQKPPKISEKSSVTTSIENSEYEKKTEPVIQKMIPKPGIGDHKIPRNYTAPRYALSGVSKKDLRKAIVWSEILGLPKALRNE